MIVMYVYSQLVSKLEERVKTNSIIIIIIIYHTEMEFTLIEYALLLERRTFLSTLCTCAHSIHSDALVIPCLLGTRIKKAPLLPVYQNTYFKFWKER